MGLASKHPAFLLYGMSSQTAKYLRETFLRFTKVPRVQTLTPALMEAGKPFFVDVSGHDSASIRQLRRTLQEANYRAYIYVFEAAMPRQLSESWIQQQATYGFIRQFANILIVENRGLKRLIEHVEAVLEAEEPKGPKPAKEPTEVDRLRDSQKQELLMTKNRQNNDMLQAKMGELKKQSRETSEKLQQSSAKG